MLSGLKERKREKGGRTKRRERKRENKYNNSYAGQILLNIGGAN